MTNAAEILNKIEREIIAKRMNYFDFVLYDGRDFHRRELLAVSPCQNCYSVTKSFTATAVGIARDMGLLSVDDTLDKFFGGSWPAGGDPKMKNVRVRHLLTHTTGIEKGSLFEADRYDNGTDDWLKYCLLLPLKYEPGERYTYSNTNFYLLSRVISRVSGMRLDRFAYKNLFKRLSIKNFAWTCCPEGETQGGTGLYLPTADMAKLGALYLNKGVWEGARVLSEAWINEATINQTASIPGVKSGFGLFISDKGYRFAGAYNQNVTIRPDLGIVVAAHGFINDEDFGAILDGAVS